MDHYPAIIVLILVLAGVIFSSALLFVESFIGFFLTVCNAS